MPIGAMRDLSRASSQRRGQPAANSPIDVLADQAHLTSLVDLDLIRQQGLRSFQRLEHAIDQLAESFHAGNMIATPV